jgi:hypothetical protein
MLLCAFRRFALREPLRRHQRARLERRREDVVVGAVQFVRHRGAACCTPRAMAFRSVIAPRCRICT